MTPEQMNAAIDEWLHPNKSWPQNALKRANYCNSLDAVHKAFCHLKETDFELWEVANKTVTLLVGGITIPHFGDVLNATAHQRAEALCRTLWPDRWKE